MNLADVAIVAIGRNEGDRLQRCLESVPSGVALLVYVDSGSEDGSIERARAAGAEVVNLDMSVPFTAARARNAGFAAVEALAPDVETVFFVDGDCEIASGWLEAGTRPFEDESVSAVCGIRREKCPGASIFNLLCDIEWRQPAVGEARSFGGDVLIRRTHLQAVGGYDPTIIAAEDDDLSIRLRQRGGRILRLPDVATLHDAAMYRWSQWLKRSIRCGHAYANVYEVHKGHGNPHFGRQLRSAVVWGGFMPVAAIVLAPTVPAAAVAILLLYGLQAGRNYVRTRAAGYSFREAAVWAPFCLLAKVPELVGIAKYYRRRLFNEQYSLIEYK